MVAPYMREGVTMVLNNYTSVWGSLKCAWWNSHSGMARAAYPRVRRSWWLNHREAPTRFL